MSIQPVLSSPPPADTVSQRRPSAERDDGSARESFALPPAEPVRENATSVREARKDAASQSGEARREAGETRRAADAAAATEDAAETQTKSQASSADTGAKAQAPASGKPGGAVGDSVASASPQASPAPSNLDIAALVSIAAAAEGENLPTQSGEATQSVGEKPVGTQVKDGADALSAALPETVSVDVAIAPLDPIAAAQTPSAPVVALPIDVALAVNVPATEGEGEGDWLAGKAQSTPGVVVIPAAAGPETADADGSDAAGSMPVLPGQSGATGAAAAGATATAEPASGIPSPTGASAIPATLAAISAATLSVTGDAGQPAKTGAVAKGGEEAAKLQGGATPAPGPAAPEPKSLETFEQALNAVDLSAGNAQGAARPDPLRLMTTQEPMAAQPGAPQGQATAASQPTPLHVLPIEIGLRALAGARQFEIRLDPGELGRVDVSLSISESGEVSAKMVVDRVETLHLLQRDARTLERAFEQAGLKPSDAGVDISLRDPADQSGFRQNRQQDEASQQRRGPVTGSETDENTSIPALSAPLRRFVRLGGVDMSV
ncbi:flagellar hook-length control protein FliK [Bosea sp. (in: a-proteobacteria)]|uniref:flagellar hook-length control protein FliK n=1 Tax=Bosea sp. (in: a-proteobacteria) TaxID=1871050 RepID=UPI002734F55B|nr:flagellar hook-length control protein FliK [Bosea sp. (in: a-proteobacteria)]MDP3407746.1 flagellar hook-length control protein FliK [Bosea sp. (in: a-proteobacteria)]